MPSTICVEVLDVQLVGKNLDGWLFKGNVGDIYRDLKICLAIDMDDFWGLFPNYLRIIRYHYPQWMDFEDKRCRFSVEPILVTGALVAFYCSTRGYQNSHR